MGLKTDAAKGIFAKIFEKDDDGNQSNTNANATPAQGAAPATSAGAGTSQAPKKHGFTNKQAKFQDVQWAKLPLSARKAAKAIGFEQSSWDGEERLHIFGKDWNDLTPEEKTACETLGWDTASWDKRYEGTYWKDLPEHAQKAAEKLGWSQQKWDEDDQVPSWQKSWHELSEEEKRCLHVLGYSVHTWVNATPTQGAPAATGAGAGTPHAPKKHGFTDKQAKYEDVKWAKLPLSARKAAKAIGFEQASWDGAEWLHIDDKHWHDLTPEEKKACETLGWEKESWDRKYEGTYWKDLPKHVQKAAEKLGWSQQTWDWGEHVPTWHKSWHDLSEEEKRCYHVLGYYVHTWG